MSRISSLSSPFLLGFDEVERVLDRVTKGSDGYPPYNVEKVETGPDEAPRLRITLAVAGFSAEQLEVTSKTGYDGILSVEVFNTYYRTLPADVVARRARASLDPLL